MAIKLDKSAFEQIDACFADIKDNKNVNKNLNEISKILTSVFGKDFTVNIMMPKRNTPLYIMSIFPEESTVEKLVDSILSEASDKELAKIWSENKKWYVEIDNRVVTGSFVEASSKELTALLLHEVGHVMTSNTIPNRMSRIMKYHYAKANIGTKNVFKSSIYKKILQIPILKACVFENYKTQDAIKKELKADLFVVKMGYGDELDSVLNKIIATSSANKDNGANINRDSSDVTDSMESDTNFSINLVEDLRKREARVSKANFHKMLLDVPSEYITKTLSGIEKTLFGPNALKSSTMVTENVMDSINALYEEAYTTEAFGFGKKVMNRIDPYIVDYAYIRKDDMKTNDDKLLLVSYIHSKIDLIDYYLSIYSDPNMSKRYVFKNSKSELERMRSTLDKLRNEIIAYKIPEVRYGIQVVYPDGYTG